MFSLILTFILGLQSLHESGFRGQGMTIAIIDCGFYGADSAAYFPQEQIIGWYDLVEDSLRTHAMTEWSQDAHGTMCLSTILYESPAFTGTAPDARFILIRTEELESEHRREVDRLARGILLADSLGADIISISLGYNRMDIDSTAFSLTDLDGSSTASRAATQAARHNRIVCIAAGNDGSRPDWGRITIPGDADSVLTVGSCTADSLHAATSGSGPTADGRIKPEVSAWGQNTYVFDPTIADIRTGSGTSFATPEIAGMVACLWQALPHLTAMQLRQAIIRSAHQYDLPDNQLGYGIPNAWLVYQRENQTTAATSVELPKQREKVLYNGHLYILIDGRWYTLTGVPLN
ncbi:MAG: S8 family serine peptidase [Paludibacteraceae bacterium]|nr:S8 family serine peptidase [Paludibacteraceae bacterium]